MPLLATTQKRPKAPIELGNPIDRSYFFVPSDPSDANSVHVCDVSEDDYDLLIKIPGYFAFRGTLAPVTARPAATTPAAPATPPAPAPEPAPGTTAAPDANAVTTSTTDAAVMERAATTTAAATTTDAAAAADAAVHSDAAEIETAALNLLDLSWQKLGAEIDKGGIPTAVAQRALDIELAKPEADQKLTIVKKLKASLGVN